MLVSMPGSSPMRPQEPIKRRRGRPPKNNKSPEAFPTLTLQFQTSPDSGSPTAESNSNMMVKMGEPDAFTPLMKVSPSIPSSRKRRRKSNYHSDIEESPSKRSSLSQNADMGPEEPLLTPMSLSSVNSGTNSYLNAKTLDNIAQVTRSDSQVSPTPKYTLATPPKINPVLRNGSSSAKSTANVPQKIEEEDEAAKKESKLSKRTSTDLMSYIDDDSFVFQLVVDDKGKAVLSNKGSSTKTKPTQQIANDQVHEASLPSAMTQTNPVMGSEMLRPIQKDGKRLESFKPTLPSYASLVSASDSDISTDKLIVPQTPQSNNIVYSETPIFMQTDTSGSNGELAFNLTPQFNAMMYSMMNINSPQQKKNFSQQQPFLNPQVDLNQYSKSNSAQVHAIDTREILGGGQDTSPESSNSDEGDARAALRKAFHRRK
ncbi:hypothetical protein CAJCM15448_22320 [Candidozyma auris]|nr:hypothetical protein CAJCM15448_22320 [[Candida] auris]